MDNIPIQSLSPADTPPTQASIHGIVTLSWPYSSSTQHCALLIADPDFRLRNRRGQVRVRFTGVSAEAVARAHVGVGDEVVLRLKGASWAPDTVNVQTPGRSVEGELLFRRRLGLRIVKAEGNVEIDVDAPTPPRPSPQESSQAAVAMTPLPSSVRDLRSSFGGAVDASPVYSSPAFIQRSRLSGNSFLNSAYDPFLDDDLNDEQPAKRQRVSFGAVGEWRYAMRSPSPTKDASGLEAASQEDPSPVYASQNVAAPMLGERHEITQSDVELQIQRPHAAKAQMAAHEESDTMNVDHDAADDILDTSSLLSHQDAPIASAAEPVKINEPAMPQSQALSNPSPLQSSPFAAASELDVPDVVSLASSPISAQERRYSATPTEPDRTLVGRIAAQVDEPHDDRDEIRNYTADNDIMQETNVTGDRSDVNITYPELPTQPTASFTEALAEESLHGSLHPQFSQWDPQTPVKMSYGFGLDGASSVTPQKQVTPQSERERVMARTLGSLFGFSKAPDVTPTSRTPEESVNVIEFDEHLRSPSPIKKSVPTTSSELAMETQIDESNFLHMNEPDAIQDPLEPSNAQATSSYHLPMPETNAQTEDRLLGLRDPSLSQQNLDTLVTSTDSEIEHPTLEVDRVLAEEMPEKVSSTGRPDPKEYRYEDASTHADTDLTASSVYEPIPVDPVNASILPFVPPSLIQNEPRADESSTMEAATTVIELLSSEDENEDEDAPTTVESLPEKQGAINLDEYESLAELDERLLDFEESSGIEVDSDGEATNALDTAIDVPSIDKEQMPLLETSSRKPQPARADTQLDYLDSLSDPAQWESTALDKLQQFPRTVSKNTEKVAATLEVTETPQSDVFPDVLDPPGSAAEVTDALRDANVASRDIEMVEAEAVRDPQLSTLPVAAQEKHSDGLQVEGTEIAVPEAEIQERQSQAMPFQPTSSHAAEVIEFGSSSSPPEEMEIDHSANFVDLEATMASPSPADDASFHDVIDVDADRSSPQPETLVPDLHQISAEAEVREVAKPSEAVMADVESLEASAEADGTTEPHQEPQIELHRGLSHPQIHLESSDDPVVAYPPLPDASQHTVEAEGVTGIEPSAGVTQPPPHANVSPVVRYSSLPPSPEASQSQPQYHDSSMAGMQTRLQAHRLPETPQVTASQSDLQMMIEPAEPAASISPVNGVHTINEQAMDASTDNDMAADRQLEGDHDRADVREAEEQTASQDTVLSIRKTLIGDLPEDDAVTEEAIDELEQPPSIHEKRLDARDKKTPARRSLRTRLSNVPDVISAFFSSRRSSGVVPDATPAKISAGRASKRAVEIDEGLAPINGQATIQNEDATQSTQTSNEIITASSYYTLLSDLHRRVNLSSQGSLGGNSVDVLAVVTNSTKAPERAKGGPRDYYTILRITDSSLAEGTSFRVDVFRPWKAVLPVAEVGDVILLRSFAVKSRKHQPYLLSTDGSAWCVWRYAEGHHVDDTSQRPTWARKHVEGHVDGIREEVKGPPVELGMEEREHAKALREWWVKHNEMNVKDDTTDVTAVQHQQLATKL